ncbi:hypothetical protein [Kitasatospora azatica]|uniref:hypothetical protein n=1 Tax=Kitasatospora azatica TaxID=58347 RepID=UPI000A9766A1|nr:hypothetical protein [Kitasatospora azatica]
MNSQSVAPLPPDTAPLLGFKPYLQVEAVPGEAVYLVSEQRFTALHGGPIHRLAPLLDGTRSREAVLREVADLIPQQQADRLLDRLAAADLLTEHPGPQPAHPVAELAYWEAAGLAGARRWNAPPTRPCGSRRSAAPIPRRCATPPRRPGCGP